MTTAAAAAWTLPSRSGRRGSVRLFCLPYAGGGASLYNGWEDEVPASVELQAVQLPGRENRMQEPPYTRLAPLVDALATAVGAQLDRPFAIFGHSMGALLGFELAHRLRALVRREPLLLVVSGHRAPHLPADRQPVHRLPTADLVDRLRELAGTPPEVIENAELRQLILPAVRADFELCETYAYEGRPPLACPVLAFGGLDDDVVSHQQLAAWRRHTTGTFDLAMLPGNHFFPIRSRGALLAVLADRLAALATTHRGGGRAS